MSVAVIGAGRSGTNIVLEMLRGNNNLEATINVEDKLFFKRNKTYPAKYLTKCDTVYFNEKDIEKTVRHNPDLKIIFCIRDPRDMLMSKLKRGQTIENGGDCKVLADDATPDGALQDINRAFNSHQALAKSHGKNTIEIKMEASILYTSDTCKLMSDFIGIPYQESMLDFPSRMRNEHKVKRYGKSISKTQTGLYLNWKEYENGYLLKYDMENLFKQVRHITEHFNYAT